MLKITFVTFTFTELEWVLSAVLYVQNHSGIRAMNLSLKISC